MTIIMIIIEAAAILLLLYGYWKEEDVIRWERALWKKTCTMINRWIRAYERRCSHGS